MDKMWNPGKIKKRKGQEGLDPNDVPINGRF